ncbi:MAG: thioesterase family protein [Pseudomonadota bacterium]
MDMPYLTPLSTAQLREAQIPEPWTFGMMDRVRFGELDVLGHVNNTAYLRWFENFRIHYFRDYGVNTYKGTPPRIVLKSISLDFKAEVLLHDDYIVTGRTASFRSSSFVMEYAVWVRGTCTTLGGAIIVSLNPDSSKRPLPEALKETFQTRDGAASAL